MAEANGSDTSKAGASGEPAKIEIDGQQLSAEDVNGLLEHKEALGQLQKQLSPVLKAMERYNLDPEALVSNADMAFHVVNNLIEQGIIDEKGTVVAKKSTEPPPKSFVPPRTPEVGEAGPTDRAIKPIIDALASITKRLDELDDGQASLLRGTIEGKLKAQYPDFDDDDVAKVMGTAYRERASVWDVAKIASEQKTTRHQELRKRHAAEFGMDLDEFDRNKVLEKSAEGGPGALFQGKKFVLPRRAKRLGLKPGDYVDPSEAVESVRKLFKRR